MDENQNLMKKLRRYRGLILAVPFARCVILNGSLARGKAKKTSDIDLLIIAKNNRLWTCRFFLLLLLTLLSQKRSKTGENHAGKFCVNYFLTEDFLEIPHDRDEKQNKYCAENYSQAVFIGGSIELFAQYQLTNKDWWQQYGWKTTDNNNLKTLKFSKFFQWLPEQILKAKFGSLIENLLRKQQIKKIESDPITKRYPDRIVYNEKEARFHPPKLD